jgi:2-polyprenyl-3-methyl-5-hydroxy-6-metoxy-1,4-benzoquinol methylase/glycosyltransferase involved in cell wall biosynthesis
LLADQVAFSTVVPSLNQIGTTSPLGVHEKEDSRVSLRILTFNWHESYIHLLSKTGYDFDVVEREKAGIYGWIEAIRPVPSNCRLVSEAAAREELRSGAYDRIIAHNLNDLLFVREWTAPKVLVFHNKLTTEIALSRRVIERKSYLERVAELLAETRELKLVFISQAKQLDWGLVGEVILPGIDPEDYNGYAGQEAAVLRVGNGLKERDIMLGYSLQERVVGRLPSKILGLNAHIPEAYVPRDWDEYRGFLRSHRVFFNTTQEPYEDGYNLAMLEAMATGMPIVSTANRSSPIEDGVNGFLSEDESELRERLEALLKHRSLGISIGRRARQTVLDRFPMRVFVDRWVAVLTEKNTLKTEAAGTDGRDERSAKRGTDNQMSGLGQQDSEEVSVPLAGYYRKERYELAALVPKDAHRILDVGCGGGHLGRLLKEQSELREVWGVDVHIGACHEAEKWLDHVVHADACQWDPPVDKGYFDLIVLGDVLEHLLDPKGTLEHYLPWLKPSGMVVLSMPNVRYWGVVQNLVNGHWTYEAEGILDRDHVRFFTWNEIERLLASCGLECAEVRWNLDTRCPDVPDGKTTDLRLGRITIHDLGPDECREFFVFQYLVRCVRTKEGLLAEAEGLEASGRGEEAFGTYADLLAGNGEDPKLVRKLAELAKTEQEKTRASALIEECLRLHPANVELLIASAGLLVEEERVEEAKQRLERILLFVPDHPEAKARLDGLGC